MSHLFSLIEKLRNKPENYRRKFAISSSIILTAFSFLIISSFNNVSSQDRNFLSENREGGVEGPIKTVVSISSGVFGEVSSQFNNLRNLTSGIFSNEKWEDFFEKDFDSSDKSNLRVINLNN